MGVTERLAAFAAATRYRDIPVEIVALAKERMLDTLGVTLGGSVEA